MRNAIHHAVLAWNELIRLRFVLCCYSFDHFLTLVLNVAV